MTHTRRIVPCDLSIINQAIVDGKLQAMPFSWYQQFDRSTLDYFMYVNTFYTLPTTELIEHFRANIRGMAIEICAGHGAIGRSLKIPITDSFQQADNEKSPYLSLMVTPSIKYPSDVEKINAYSALLKYNPMTIVGAFVTHRYFNGMVDGNVDGVEEEKIIMKAKRYMIVGNEFTHQHKPILRYPHESMYAEWIITRANDQSKNRIWTWTRA